MFKLSTLNTPVKLILCSKPVIVVCIVSFPSRRKQQLMQAIQSYKPDIKTVHQARVLLVGPVGAGKSSFFNSINSLFRGNMTSQAIAGTAGRSVTSQVLAQLLVFVILRCRVGRSDSRNVSTGRDLAILFPPQELPLSVSDVSVYFN